LQEWNIDNKKGGLYMNKKPMKNGFTAEKCSFQGVPGYTVKQWHDGICICSQFIPKSSFQSFCDAVGVAPVML